MAPSLPYRMPWFWLLLGFLLPRTLLAQATTSNSNIGSLPTNVTVELVDADSGAVLPGVLRVRDASGHAVRVDTLMERGLGIAEPLPIHDWHILTGPASIALASGRYTLEGFSGLETEIGMSTIDVPEGATAPILCSIKVQRFYDSHARGLQNANTHVHLKKVGYEDGQRYLVNASRADGLELVYVSYLERAEEDLEYTSNKFSLTDLQRLTRESHDQAEAHRRAHARQQPHHHRQATEFDNGQEHRHNFDGFGEGFGHVLFLHLPELVQPVSIGPGITGKGTDSPPLSPGIQMARDLGTTVIWCHNRWGMEDIPNWLSGRLHANNIFDGGARGSYQHSFYRYLNAGLKVPFSTGTDWFIYDFSRVYVLAPPGRVGGGKYLSSEEWLGQLAQSRSFITNGPLLEFTVNEQPIGDVVRLPKAAEVRIAGKALGRCDFERLEMIRNGKVIHSESSRRSGNHFEANLDIRIPVEEPCWFAIRTPAPSDPEYADFQRKTPLNEYGCELFSHTSAIHVEVGGESIFEAESAESLLQEMRSNLEMIQKRGVFANEQEKRSVAEVYDKAIDSLRLRIERAR